LRVTEVASWEYERQYGASKLNTFRDGWRVLGALFKERRRAPIVPTARPVSDEAISFELDAIVAAELDAALDQVVIAS
jgi:hypothetical protein